MWWIYAKVEETEKRVVYYYSTETQELDGEIVYDKKTGEWKVTRPCAGDAGSTWRISKAEEKFRHVIEEGFPDCRKVVIG